MELIREQLDVHLIVAPRPLRKKEKVAISGFIKADKANRALKEKQSKKQILKTTSKQPACASRTAGKIRKGYRPLNTESQVN